MKSKYFFIGAFAVLVLSFVAIADARDCTLKPSGDFLCKDISDPFAYEHSFGNAKVLNYTQFGTYEITKTVVSAPINWGNTYLCENCKIVNYTTYSTGEYYVQKEDPIVMFSGKAVVEGKNKVLCTGTTIGMSIEEIVNHKGSICNITKTL